MDLTDLLGADALEVAPRLLGLHIRTAFDAETTVIALTEVEAYRGADDPASHAFRGRTLRNTPMFGPPGTLYVYRSYGIHWCMNITCGPEGVASAVLLRGGVPRTGVPTMERRRGRTHALSNGPGKLTQALGVTGEHSGTSVLEGPVWLEVGDSTRTPPGPVVATPRIGISRAKELPWRFVTTVPSN